jgi:hypothetical protein
MEVEPAQLASLNATFEDLVSLMKESGYGLAK